MRTVEIWISETTKNMLDVIKDQLKKQGKCRVSYDDALQHLFKKHEELQARKRALEQTQV